MKIPLSSTSFDVNYTTPHLHILDDIDQRCFNDHILAYIQLMCQIGLLLCLFSQIYNVFQKGIGSNNGQVMIQKCWWKSISKQLKDMYLQASCIHSTHFLISATMHEGIQLMKVHWIVFKMHLNISTPTIASSRRPVFVNMGQKDFRCPTNTPWIITDI